jgi:hypothetical protein
MMGEYYLNESLKKVRASLWTVLVWVRIGTSGHCNGSSSAIKGDTFLGKLNNH